MYACICKAVTEDEVRDKARSTCFAMSHYVGTVNVKCCKCLPRIKELINEEKREHQAEFTASAYYSTPISTTTEGNAKGTT